MGGWGGEKSRLGGFKRSDFWFLDFGKIRLWGISSFFSGWWEGTWFILGKVKLFFFIS